MKIALAARIVCDPKSVLKNRWAHDTAHAIRDSVLKARNTASKRAKGKH
jgi:hypothetical protein